jgi:hypothetical protein
MARSSPVISLAFTCPRSLLPAATPTTFALSEPLHDCVRHPGKIAEGGGCSFLFES